MRLGAPEVDHRGSFPRGGLFLFKLGNSWYLSEMNGKQQDDDTQKIELTCADYRMMLAPQAGGTILSFTHREQNILRPASALDDVIEDPREAACYPCVPWFGRTEQKFTYEDQKHTIMPTLPIADPDNPLHGYGWISSWKILERQAHSALLGLNYIPSPGTFPFAFSATQEFTLSEEGLKITLAIQNPGAKPIPAGIGLHPFFNRDPQSHIRFKSSADMNPYNSLSAVPSEHTDHSYDGFGGMAEIVNGGHAIHMKSDAPILHLYAPSDESFFCLEPVSHLPGQLEATKLKPGETKSISLRLGVV